MGRIVVLGASGYTGRLTVDALLGRGLKPVLAGRSPSKLREVADRSDLEVAEVDLSRPASLARVLRRGDVLLSTVGPFARWGEPAVAAAIQAGAHYLDSNGEPAYTRRVFDRFSGAAVEADVALLTAFGWENVTGNLAGALALEAAGDHATRVDTGYFYAGPSRFSAGTRASFAEAMVLPSFAFRDGAIETVRGAERFRRFLVDGVAQPAISLGASEHFALPRLYPPLREVNAFLGWFGGLPPATARLFHLGSRPAKWTFASSRMRELAVDLLGRLPSRSDAGPSASERQRAGVRGIGAAHDEAGTVLAEVVLRGPEGYELTAALLAWGAEQLRSRPVPRYGALGPIDAFGLHRVVEGAAACGLVAASER